MVIHCGTNDLKSNEDNGIVATNIIDLAKKVSERTRVCVSSLTPQNDRFKARISEINSIIKVISDRNIGFIDHDNINPLEHLNRSRLHLNKKGSELLTTNLHHFLKD